MGTRLPYCLADSPEGRTKEGDLTGLPQPTTQTSSGVRKGFVSERVPHVTLKSIANNPDIREGMSREEINAAISRHADTELLYDRAALRPAVRGPAQSAGRRAVHGGEPVAAPRGDLGDRTTGDRAGGHGGGRRGPLHAHGARQPGKGWRAERSPQGAAGVRVGGAVRRSDDPGRGCAAWHRPRGRTAAGRGQRGSAVRHGVQRVGQGRGAGGAARAGLRHAVRARLCVRRAGSGDGRGVPPRAARRLRGLRRSGGWVGCPCLSCA